MKRQQHYNQQQITKTDICLLFWNNIHLDVSIRGENKYRYNSTLLVSTMKSFPVAPAEDINSTRTQRHLPEHNHNQVQAQLQLINKSAVETFRAQLTSLYEHLDVVCSIRTLYAAYSDCRTFREVCRTFTAAQEAPFNSKVSCGKL